MQGLYWTLPRDRVEELYEDEIEDKEEPVVAKEEDVEGSKGGPEGGKDKDKEKGDSDAAALEKSPTLVFPLPLLPLSRVALTFAHLEPLCKVSLPVHCSLHARETTMLLAEPAR